jgi:D-xylose transport system permease protein
MDEHTPSPSAASVEVREPPPAAEPLEDLTAAPESEVELAAAAPELLAESLPQYLRAWLRRIRAGESGALPIVIGLVVIIVFFQLERSQFLGAQNLVNLFQQASIYVLLGAAEVFALVLSEIDLSVGYVPGIGGLVIAELIASPVNLPWWAGIIGGLGATGLIGYVQGSLITRLHVPSFVVTLAGLLIWEGVLIELANVDKSAVGGVMTVAPTSPVYHLVNSNMSPTVGWIVLGVLLVVFAAAILARTARRRAQGLSAPPLSITWLTIAATAVGGILVVYICSLNRSNGVLPLKGIPWVIPFVGVVLFLFSVLLGRTRTGRYMYAIGANPEAARRAGLNVYASLLGSVSTDVPGGNYTLYGVAAAVIGGASLFGGRGKPLHALLGGLVIGVVYNGLALMNISAQGQFIATGIVLVVAATVDALVRRRGASGAV